MSWEDATGKVAAEYVRENKQLRADLEEARQVTRDAIISLDTVEGLGESDDHMIALVRKRLKKVADKFSPTR